MQSKRLIILGILLSFAVSQVSCQKGSTPVKQPFGGTLTIGQISSPGTLNPLLEVSGVSAQIINIIFDGLIVLGNKGEVLPGLAASWDVNEGGREWVFHLRKGVKFHDGHPLTAEDVEFTFNLAKDIHGLGSYAYPAHQIRDMGVKDPYTISFQLIEPSASFIHTMTLGILPRHLLQGQDIHNTSFNRQPIGTGPFHFTRWYSDRIELVANQNYYLGRPYLDRVVVRLFKNHRLALANLMKGEIDAFQILDPSLYEIIKKVPSFRVYSALKTFYYIIGFNLANPLFHDKRVRQALNYAVDKEIIIKNALKGRGVISSSTIPPCSWAFDHRIRPFPYDPRKAQKLLKEAGWRDTDGDHILDKNNQLFQFQIYVPEGHDEMETSSLMIAEQLLAIGIMVRINKLSIEVFNQKHLLSREFDTAFMYIQCSGDPDKDYQFWHSSQIENGFNFFSYHNSRVDQLLDQGRCTLDPEQRKKIYVQYQQGMQDDPPCIFLFWRHYFLGIDKRFQGINISPFGMLTNVREWYIAEDEAR